MVKIYTLFFIILGIAFTANALDRNVSGLITDKQTNEPIEGVVLQVEGTKLATTTNKFGSFSFISVPEGSIITISHLGYSPIQVELNGTGKLNLQLERGNFRLQDVILNSNLNNSYLNTISKVDLNLRPVRSSQELLRAVPGLFIAQHAGGGKAEQIFLRGFDIDHGTDVQLTVDGLPVNMVSHGHGQGYADLHFVIPELVKNIDYGKGPYYTEHGNLNTAGYVGFQTKNQLEQDRYQLEGGQFGHFRALAMANLLPKTSIKQNAFIASEYMHFNGPFISAQNFNRLNVFGKYSNQLSPSAKLTFIASAFSSKWDASGQIPQRTIDEKLLDRFGAIDDTEGGHTGRYNASINISGPLKNGHSYESQLYYSRYYFQLFSNFTFFLRDSINGDQIKQNDERDIVGFNSKYTIPFSIGATNLKTTFGSTIRHDKTYDTELSYSTKRVFLEHVKLGDITESNAAVYIDQKIEYRKWLINIGSRLDYLHFFYNDKLTATIQPAQNKAIISPKLNAQYTFNNKFQAYFKAGKGFHSNDTRVVTGNQGRQILPPAFGADLGFNYHPSKNLILNAAAWYLYLQQEFVYVGDEGIIEPSGRSKRVGLDFSGRYQFNKNLFADAHINLASARFIDNSKEENRIPLAPVFTTTGGINYTATNGWNGSLRYRMITDRPANESNSVIAKGYFLADAALNYTKAKYEIGIAVENIFNTIWNEAQFDTESKLRNEIDPVSELHFTPGTPFFTKIKLAIIL